jgi:citrate lyase beta subunit
LIAAYQDGLARGAGVTTFKGKLVEVIHVIEAQRVLALAAIL